MTGLQVRIAGPIDARLLPTALDEPFSASTSRAPARPVRCVRAGSASNSRSASLARGELKATDVLLEGAEITIALDRNGRLEWPAPSIGFDPESISIERLDIRDSRALLADTASGYGVVLDKLEFKGELRTLAGPVKGQGSFYADGQHYPYRIAASRVGDERVRVRLNIDPIDRPLTADAEGFVSIENGAPRFAGTLTLARPVTRAPAGSQAQILEPWRLTGKIDGNSTRAVIEQIEFQYGPDDRPIRLRGDALINRSVRRPDSTACCRRRRSILTASWPCRSRSAAGRLPRSKPSPIPSLGRSGCRSRFRSESASKASRLPARRCSASAATSAASRTAGTLRSWNSARRDCRSWRCRVVSVSRRRRFVCRANAARRRRTRAR